MTADHSLHPRGAPSLWRVRAAIHGDGVVESMEPGTFASQARLLGVEVTRGRPPRCRALEFSVVAGNEVDARRLARLRSTRFLRVLGLSSDPAPWIEVRPWTVAPATRSPRIGADWPAVPGAARPVDSEGMTA